RAERERESGRNGEDDRRDGHRRAIARGCGDETGDRSTDDVPREIRGENETERATELRPRRDRGHVGDDQWERRGARPVEGRADERAVPVGQRYERRDTDGRTDPRSEEHTSELQSRGHLVCRLLLEKKNGARIEG